MEGLNILILEFSKHSWRMNDLAFNIEVLNNTIDQQVYGISKITDTDAIEVAVLQDTVLKYNSTLTIITIDDIEDFTTDEIIDLNLTINKCDILLVKTNPYTFDSIIAILNTVNRKRFKLKDIDIEIGDWVDFKNSTTYVNLFMFVEKIFNIDIFDCNYRNQFDSFIPTILIDNLSFYKKQIREFNKLTVDIISAILIYTNDEDIINKIIDINTYLSKRNEFKGLIVNVESKELIKCIKDIPFANEYMVNYTNSFEDDLKDLSLPDNKLIINLFIDPTVDYSKLKMFIRDNYFKIKYIKINISDFTDKDYLKTIEYFIKESIALIYKYDRPPQTQGSTEITES